MTEETLVGEQINTEAVEETSLVGGAAEELTEEVKSEEIKEETKEEIKEEIKELEDFKFPEGVVIDEEFAKDFKGVAKELNLNQEQAQKLVDLQSKFTQGYSEKVSEQFKTQVNDWKQESIAELGANYKQALAVVAKAMNSFGSPELRQLLNNTGLGNHKEVVKLFLNMGKMVSEDKMKDGDLGKERITKSLAEKHYPNTKS